MLDFSQILRPNFPRIIKDKTFEKINIKIIISIYSQTCSNEHLYTTTTRLRQPIPSPPKQIPIQALLYKTTNCLNATSDHIFCLPNEKNYLKQPLQNFTQQRNEKQT